MGELLDPSRSDVSQRRRRMGVDDGQPRYNATRGAARGDRPVVDDGSTDTEPADQPDMPRLWRRFALGGISWVSTLHSRKQIESHGRRADRLVVGSGAPRAASGWRGRSRGCALALTDDGARSREVALGWVGVSSARRTSKLRRKHQVGAHRKCARRAGVVGVGHRATYPRRSRWARATADTRRSNPRTAHRDGPSARSAPRPGRSPRSAT